MSHEIRTPLNGVIGVAAALARTDLTPEQGEMVGLIESSGVTLQRLVSDVLDVSKIEAGRMEIETREFDLTAELGGVLEVFRIRSAERGLAFPITHGATARGVFLGDAVRLKQVLGNLLSNAVKFTEQGEVRVAIELVEGDDDAPAQLTLEVADTGVGFDAAFAQQMFQRFAQADGTITRRFGGTGLGLSITRALVELMGGRVLARSEPGRGSLFRVELPLPRSRALADYDAAALHALSASRDLAQAAGERLAGLRVLLAEDHPVNRRVVELVLGPFGVELTMAEDGAQALAACADHRFDAVLMDMQMPVLDGLAATRAIRGHEAAAGHARTPVIMLSANTMEQHVAEALAAGADRHLAKPVTAAALIAALADAVGPVPARTPA